MTVPRPAVRWFVNVDCIERSRIRNGWTRGQLAAVAQVDPKTLTDMCNGRRRPNFATLQAVSAALGLTMADVIILGSDER